MADNDLLEATMVAIENDPDGHDQNFFFRTTACRTTLCFAGQAAVLCGAQPPKTQVDWYVGPDLEAARSLWSGVRAQHVADFAQKHLGLTHDQAQVFFYLANTAADLRVLVDAVKADPEVRRAALVMALEVHRGEDY